MRTSRPEGRGHRRILRAEEVVQETVMFLTGAQRGQSNRDVVSLPDTLAVPSAA